MESVLKCCFIGHRNVDESDEIISLLNFVISGLIKDFNVKIFSFGSRSMFDYICHKVVSGLKDKYTDIKRIAYTCRSETCVLEEKIEYWKEIYKSIYKKEVVLYGVEQEVDYETKYTSARADYIERNKAMIDASDFCVFYYNENYKPTLRKKSKRDVSLYQPKSGTKIAYEYAKKKGKKIINIYDLLNK